jgi:hypothetical protein
VTSRIIRSLASLLLVALTTCDAAGIVSPGTELMSGTWGGDNAGAIVSDAITHVHVGCTFGDIPGRIALDASGRFTVDGSYVLRAYPVLVGPSHPAQFSGQVVGRRLTLVVAVNDTVEKRVVALGPVTVVLGIDPRMGPCPICRVPGMRLARPPH